MGRSLARFDARLRQLGIVFSPPLSAREIAVWVALEAAAAIRRSNQIAKKNGIDVDSADAADAVEWLSDEATVAEILLDESDGGSIIGRFVAAAAGAAPAGKDASRKALARLPAATRSCWPRCRAAGRST